jgi:hypothetical protein
MHILKMYTLAEIAGATGLATRRRSGRPDSGCRGDGVGGPVAGEMAGEASAAEAAVRARGGGDGRGRRARRRRARARAWGGSGRGRRAQRRRVSERVKGEGDGRGLLSLTSLPSAHDLTLGKDFFY